MEATPLTLAFIGIGLLVGLAGCGSAIGTAVAAMSSVGALKKTTGLVWFIYRT